MDIKVKLQNELETFVKCPIVDPVYRDFETNGMKYLQLRDGLISLGQIVLEDIDNQSYIAIINAGAFLKNPVAVAILLVQTQLHVLAYAKEGLINQHTSTEAISKIESWLRDKQFLVEKEKKEFKSIFKRADKKTTGVSKSKVFVLMAVIIVGIVALIYYINTLGATIQEYNVKSRQFNIMAGEYNVMSSKTSIDNIDGMAREIPFISEMQEGPGGCFQALKDGLTTSKIKQASKKLEDSTNDLINDYRVMLQITDPEEEWILNRLAEVRTITGSQPVTYDNDPNAMLGKDGGYSSCIYFTVDKIEQGTVPGKNIIDKGTDAGGAIEVYKDLLSAENRCEYLSQFDNTLLYTGSYAILGTMVIRTSYRLSNEDQFELTSMITKAFTRLEPEEGETN